MVELRLDNPYVESKRADTAKKTEFPPDVFDRFQRILERYPTKQAALLPTLHLAQETFGWLAPETVVYVAEQLKLTPAYVFGVISFYNMYNQQPRGKYFLQVCTNLSCMLRGGYDIYGHICHKLGLEPGKNSEDGLHTVVEVECLGSCGTAPVVQVNNDYHEDMTIEKTDELLERLK